MNNNELVILNKKQIVNEIGKTNVLHSSLSNCLNDVSKKFLEVGYYLNRILENESFKDFGYLNIYDYAKGFFNLGQTTCKNFMNLFKKFADLGYHSDSYVEIKLKKEFEKFSYSQLVELLSLNEEEIINYNPDMTVKEIRFNKKQDVFNKVVINELESFVENNSISLINAFENYNLNDSNIRFSQIGSVKFNNKSLSVIFKFKLVSLDNMDLKGNNLTITIKSNLRPGYDTENEYCINFSFKNHNCYSYCDTIFFKKISDLNTENIFSKKVKTFINGYLKDYLIFLKKEEKNKLSIEAEKKRIEFYKTISNKFFDYEFVKKHKLISQEMENFYNEFKNFLNLSCFYFSFRQGHLYKYFHLKKNLYLQVSYDFSVYKLTDNIFCHYKIFSKFDFYYLCLKQNKELLFNLFCGQTSD